MFVSAILKGVGRDRGRGRSGTHTHTTHTCLHDVVEQMHDSHSPKGVLSKEFGKSGRCKVLPTHHMQKGKERVGGGRKGVRGREEGSGREGRGRECVVQW